MVPIMADSSGEIAIPRDTRGRPLHDLRISVTDRCNFRCPYCMPADQFHDRYAFLPKEALLSFEEITQVATIAAQLGVVKLRITGGEPLLRKDLPRLVERLAAISGIEDVALTTNGMLLARHAQALKDAGLHRVTVSLDSIDPAIFATMSGGHGSVEEVLAGIQCAQEVGLGHVKVNCVVVRDKNSSGVTALAKHFRGTGIVLRFIEYMDVGTLNHWARGAVTTAREIVDAIHAQYPLVPLDPNYTGEVATRYAYADGAGEIGVIASVTQPFCGDCSRLRMSVEGKLYTCLFAHEGFDLRPLLRNEAPSEERLRQAIAERWRGRTDRYSEVRATKQDTGDKVEMYHIGG